MILNIPLMEKSLFLYFSILLIYSPQLIILTLYKIYVRVFYTIILQSNRIMDYFIKNDALKVY